MSKYGAIPRTAEECLEIEEGIRFRGKNFFMIRGTGLLPGYTGSKSCGLKKTSWKVCSNEGIYFWAGWIFWTFNLGLGIFPMGLRRRLRERGLPGLRRPGVGFKKSLPGVFDPPKGGSLSGGSPLFVGRPLKFWGNFVVPGVVVQKFGEPPRGFLARGTRTPDLWANSPENMSFGEYQPRLNPGVVVLDPRLEKANKCLFPQRRLCKTGE